MNSAQWLAASLVSLVSFSPSAAQAGALDAMNNRPSNVATSDVTLGIDGPKNSHIEFVLVPESGGTVEPQLAQLDREGRYRRADALPNGNYIFRARTLGPVNGQWHDLTFTAGLTNTPILELI